tara:strand:- start:1075 stop:1866 length:792 start_codon:yes stop_codon:yes gene_type:complete
MKITIFTSNQSRHNYLINKFSEISETLFVIQEKKIIIKEDHINKKDNLKSIYFSKVNKAQNLIFKDHKTINKNSTISLLKINMGELSSLKIDMIKDYLKSDLYIVFGSSYIKGELIEFLINQNTINIHMGISPFYRGSACNFWALYDNNSHLVGATIHKLTKGLDDGPIIYHAISEQVDDCFIYTMSTVKSAILSLYNIIQKRKLHKLTANKQLDSKKIRYSKHKDFNDAAIIKFNSLKLNKKPFDYHSLKDFFLLKKEDFFL